jgi:hydrogenase maturation protein HypF
MRLKLQITGLVQGVGFRPFVFKLAKKLGLRGYVLNNNSGVSIEVEGKKQKLNDFLIRVDRDKPDISTIFSLQHSFIRNNRPAGQAVYVSLYKLYELRPQVYHN